VFLHGRYTDMELWILHWDFNNCYSSVVIFIESRPFLQRTQSHASYDNHDIWILIYKIDLSILEYSFITRMIIYLVFFCRMLKHQSINFTRLNNVLF
jgi:hypothetical protein